MGAKGIKGDKQTSERQKMESDSSEGISGYLEQVNSQTWLAMGESSSEASVGIVIGCSGGWPDLG